METVESKSGSSQLRTLYEGRFGSESRRRLELWRTLCEHFFQAWVPDDAVVLDLAAGGCEFINNIRSGRRIAVDLNPEVVEHAGPGVEAHICRSDALAPIESGSVDRVFVSNFFEHISREEILATLGEVRRVLKPNGKLLVLQPNIRFCGRNYWMFFDHITPVDDRALAEAFILSELRVEFSLPRFLPYTTKSRIPTHPTLVRLYLRSPWAWRILGGQAFIVGVPAVR